MSGDLDIPPAAPAVRVDLGKLEEAVEALKNHLRGSLLASSIWDRRTRTMLVAFHSDGRAVPLFTDIADFIDEKLAKAGLPGIDQWSMDHLKGGHIGMVVRHGPDLMQGIILDGARAQSQLGLLFSVCVPQLVASVKAARIG
jgi:hypothetical protein